MFIKVGDYKGTGRGNNLSSDRTIMYPMWCDT